MKKQSLAFSFLSLLSVILLFGSCKKINEATELGGDLIPAVDNITTFDTTLNVESYNNIFTEAEDSARSVSTDDQFVGNINNDPLFGKTAASMFFELKPSSYKYSFPFSKDSIVSFDSVVLVLGYHKTYGDSMLPQQVNVYELATGNTFRYDSAYSMRTNNFTLGSALAPTKTFMPQNLKDSVFPFRERAANQLRIPLDISFGKRLLNYDTTNAYASDSAFKTFFNGFAVVPQNNGIANALVGFNLADTNTKLSFYVRYIKNGVLDTSVIYFKLNSTSAAANYINRDYSGSQLATYADNNTPANLIFLQNTPGTYGTIKIPGLGNLSNRIIHRAELIVEQVSDPSDQTFPPPTYLFLDAFDSAKKVIRTIPYDFALDASNAINFKGLGYIGKATTDASGNAIDIWKFDISRYIQHVVNKTEPVYNLRLSAPFSLRETYRINTTDVVRVLPNINPTYGIGRVRLGGGNNLAQPMRLHIVYSKLP